LTERSVSSTIDEYVARSYTSVSSGKPYCLQNGLPLDTDVYDLATYSSIVELSERSVNARSAVVEFPDYTKGGWKTAKPFTVDEIDMSKFDFSKGVKRDRDAQTT
jgi:hypothetical protein